MPDRRSFPLPAASAAPGFTLLECAIALAVAAVLLRAAAPDLTRAASARALAAQAGEFMSALRFARSAAIERGAAVTVCAADPAAAADAPRCQPARAADWRAGWLVFADAGARGAFGDGDRLLRVQPALARSGGVAGTRGFVSFNAAGVSPDAASHYLFQPPPTASERAPAALLVCVSKQGRPRLVAAESCS
jgi:prepilin-type N-terminal cleavage/methylation domain-containing protein